jgi:hypothetical protein
MVIDVGNPTGLTQAVKILTDIEKVHSAIICPITATLTPSKAFIQLSSNYDLISILSTQIISPSDYGSYDLTLTVNSPDFSGSVTQKTYSFSVLIKCTITDFQMSNPVTDTTYVIT